MVVMPRTVDHGIRRFLTSPSTVNPSRSARPVQPVIEMRVAVRSPSSTITNLACPPKGDALSGRNAEPANLSAIITRRRGKQASLHRVRKGPIGNSSPGSSSVGSRDDVIMAAIIMKNRVYLSSRVSCVLGTSGAALPKVLANQS